jgi:hypothetical protein
MSDKSSSILWARKVMNERAKINVGQFTNDYIATDTFSCQHCAVWCVWGLCRIHCGRNCIGKETDQTRAYDVWGAHAATQGEYISIMKHLGKHELLSCQVISYLHEHRHENTYLAYSKLGLITNLGICNTNNVESMNSTLNITRTTGVISGIIWFLTQQNGEY